MAGVRAANPVICRMTARGLSAIVPPQYDPHLLSIEVLNALPARLIRPFPLHRPRSRPCPLPADLRVAARGLGRRRQSSLVGWEDCCFFYYCSGGKFDTPFGAACCVTPSLFCFIVSPVDASVA